MRPLDERAHDRALVRRREVGAPRAPRRRRGREPRRERGLHAGEGEVEPGDARDRKRERLGVALAREAVDRRAAGIAEPEQSRALVERLAGRVVERRAEDVPLRMVVHVQQQRVPAAREQAEERRLERLGLEEERRDVAVQVVDRDERQPARPGERLRGLHADEQRADQAGPARDRDGVDVVERRACFRERLADDGRRELEVPARRDLRHDAAVTRVQLRLRRDDVRANESVFGHDGTRGLVAGRLEREDHASPSEADCSPGSRHMISASSRLSV